MYRISCRLPLIAKLIVVALVSVVHTCLAQTPTPRLIRVEWEYDVKTPLNATVGDTIEFSWSRSSYHDVFIHPSGNCDDETEAIPVYPYATIGGSVNYTFTANDAVPGGKALFFVCEVGDGIHCHFNVNQLVIVYPSEYSPPTVAPVTTPTPTATPTFNAAVTTGAPSSAPSLSSSTAVPYGTLSPSMFPTSSFNGTTAFPTVAPSYPPTTTAPSVATGSPSTPPILQTSAPSISNASMAPTLGESPAPSSATVAPTLAPTLKPSISTAPSLLPSTIPSGAPSTATPSPTTWVKRTSLLGLEMTLFGTNALSEEDIAIWESVTSLYQTSYYADGQSGVLDLETTLRVTSSTRRRLEDAASSGPSLTLTYNQNMTYRLSDTELTPAVIVSTPFSTEDSRSRYVNLYLNNVGDTSVLIDVTAVSPVGGGGVDGTSTPPPAESNEEGEQLKKNDGGLSGGAIVGIIVASLVVCVLCCLVSAQRHEGENEWDEEEENPYIPPSPTNFENYSASNMSADHNFLQE